MGVITPYSFTPSLNRLQKTTTLIVNNTTGSATIATLTGTVLVHRMFGQVTTVLSANVTAAFVELYDQTASPDISAAGGVSLSDAPVGSMIWRSALVTGALAYDSSAAGFFQDGSAVGDEVFTHFIVGKKTGATTIIRFTYSTTDAPSSGAILWTLDWEPLSTDGNLT